MKNLVLALCLSGCLAAAARAEGAKAAKAAPMTTEQRQKMADVHEKMAACLRSERPVPDCRSEMMTSCKDAMGASGCPMMDGMGSMKHHGQMMEPEKPK